MAHLFVMRLSASGQAFRRAYLNEAQEVFLDGHVRAFEAFGGVPGTVRYDNLKAAVVRVIKGRDRLESERFVALRSHYGFESFYCRPGLEGSHEKGGVEGEIGRFRRRWLVPVPRVESMAELNQFLELASAKDSARHIDRRRDRLPTTSLLKGLLAGVAGRAVRCGPVVAAPGRPQGQGFGPPGVLFGPGPLRRAAPRCPTRCDSVEVLDGSGGGPPPSRDRQGQRV